MTKLNVELSARELEVLKILIEGFTDGEIALKLFISKETVSIHRRNLKDKLGAVNVASLVTQAFRKGLVK